MEERTDMGFNKGSYAKVWDVEPKSDTLTRLRISTSKKNKQTDQYEQDFSDYVACVGTACASKAARLSKGDKIRIGDSDVTNRYDKDKKMTYYNFKMFNFEVESGSSANNNTEPQPEVDDGEVDSRLPF